MTKFEHDTGAAKERPVSYEKPYFHKAISLIKKYAPSSPKVLDLGAGNGEFAEIAKLNIGAEVICADYAVPHLRRLKELGFETLKLDFDSSTALKKASEELKGKFDVVTAFEFIEHIFGVDDLLSFAYKALKPNGLLIVSTPNMDHSFYHIHSLLLGHTPVGEGHHVRFFNRRRLTQALVLDGFNVIEERSYGRGTAYWIYIVGERGKWAEALVRGIGRLIDFLVPETSSKKYSKLVFAARRTESPILGFDGTWRGKNYEKLSDGERHKIFSRLLPYRRENLFRDMPLFRKFFDRESRRLLKI